MPGVTLRSGHTNARNTQIYTRFYSRSTSIALIYLTHSTIAYMKNNVRGDLCEMTLGERPFARGYREATADPGGGQQFSVLPLLLYLPLSVATRGL